jgi:hypothetical protein
MEFSVKLGGKEFTQADFEGLGYLAGIPESVDRAATAVSTQNLFTLPTVTISEGGDPNISGTLSGASALDGLTLRVNIFDSTDSSKWCLAVVTVAGSSFSGRAYLATVKGTFASGTYRMVPAFYSGEVSTSIYDETYRQVFSEKGTTFSTAYSSYLPSATQALLIPRKHGGVSGIASLHDQGYKNNPRVSFGFSDEFCHPTRSLVVIGSGDPIYNGSTFSGPYLFVMKAAGNSKTVAGTCSPSLTAAGQTTGNGFFLLNSSDKAYLSMFYGDKGSVSMYDGGQLVMKTRIVVLQDRTSDLQLDFRVGLRGNSSVLGHEFMSSDGIGFECTPSANGGNLRCVYAYNGNKYYYDLEYTATLGNSLFLEVLVNPYELKAYWKVNGSVRHSASIEDTQYSYSRLVHPGFSVVNLTPGGASCGIGVDYLLFNKTVRR